MWRPYECGSKHAFVCKSDVVDFNAGGGKPVVIAGPTEEAGQGNVQGGPSGGAPSRSSSGGSASGEEAALVVATESSNTLEWSSSFEPSGEEESSFGSLEGSSSGSAEESSGFPWEWSGEESSGEEDSSAAPATPAQKLLIMISDAAAPCDSVGVESLHMTTT